ncbi:hypothetical protein, conserved [Trypanosoma brucei gambiense DAL972]|uniref:Uncharacterized protein n=1 Tax=Trypanosoma brucei gambiense (strain MHOM/CI/86/DAL972) TaxID=679716 RepID=C9ZNW7_TRYB9|nr:hypothetical protein, conserved [Trypanosoma brucei gambiense DAL972]CBH11095.1 hypothetical protein, conserved [Trypanosoma brucei gambiense DAL972]|eukprot:XP_011773382.1 hypothetical protein, conserved [Trypanosoma brucei gambiense DAL972]
MPPKLRQHFHQKAAAAAAAAEVESGIAGVEETLRRLGLVGGADKAGRNSTRAKDSEEYLASIRKAKEEAARLLRERECRQYAVEEQKREDEVTLSGNDREKALQSVIEEARFILEEEKRKAMESVTRQLGKSDERVIRAKELRAALAVRDREVMLMEGVHSPAVCGESKDSMVVPDVKERRRALKAAAAREYCNIIANGIVELAIRVFDNMYTPIVYNNIPLRRFPQDLGVTKWRAWVEELIFSKTGVKPLSDLLATTSLRELRNTNYRAVKNLVGAAESANDVSQSVEFDCRETVDGRDATETFDGNAFDAETVMRKVTELQCRHRSGLIAKSVQEATLLLRCEEEKELEAQLDDIRRTHEGDAAEETVPGWTHQLPPVGCFLFGDELSGLKQMAEALYSDVPLEATILSGKQRTSNSQLADVTRNTFDWDTTSGDCMAHRVILASQLIRGHQMHSGQGGSGSASTSGTKVYKGAGASSTGTSRLKDVKQAEDFVESKQYIDALCEALVKELVAVYQYNIMLVLRPSADASEGVTEAPPMMRLLFLVGFPDTEVFLRTLHQRLHLALEVLEHEVTRMLREEECGDECGSVTLLAIKHPMRQTLSTTASSTRKKGSRLCLSPSTRRCGNSRSSVIEAEETPPPRLRVFPPLCLVGVFLQYDIPSRYRRMRHARNRSTLTMSDILSQTTSPLLSQPFSGPTPPQHGEEDTGDSFAEWPVWRLRMELIQQDRKMRQSWKTWCARVSKAGLSHISEGERTPHVEKVKRRGRSSVTHGKSNENVSSNVSQTPIPPGLAVPKVLFFERRENLPENTEHGDLVLYLILNLKYELRPIANVLANKSLIPGQLASPLKLSDYRLPLTVLAQLVEVHDRFHARWNDLMALTPQVVQDSVLTGSSTRVQSRCATDEGNDGEGPPRWETAIALEAEMHRVFHVILSDLLDFLTDEVFPPSLWGGRTDSIPPVTPTNVSSGDRLSRTLHFMTLDDNYGVSREALYGLMSEGLTKLDTVSALLLRQVLEVALADVGEALSGLCAWAHSHMLSAPRIPAEKGNTTPSPGSPTFSPVRNHSLPSNFSTYDFVKRDFLRAAPRIEFDEILHAVQQLDGRAEAVENFQYFMWAYSSRVHETALSCLLDSIDGISKRLSVEVSNSWDVTAPRVIRQLLSELFAVPPLEGNDGFEGGAAEERRCDTVYTPTQNNVLPVDSPSPPSPPAISVSVGRLVAAIALLRRCCMTSAMCAARWVDDMYAASLRIPPNGRFPSACRPSDVAGIFLPPVAAQEEIASRSSLAVQLMEQLVPTFSIDSVKDRNCWEETGVELVLQNFSMYQKGTVNEDEFTHCVLQAQLNCIWKLLPEGLHTIVRDIGFTLPFAPKDCSGESAHIKGVSDSMFSWMRLRHCKGVAETPVLTGEDCARIFRNAVRCQKYVLLQMEYSSRARRTTLSSTVTQSGMMARWCKRPVLHLQQFLVDLLFRQPYPSGASSADYTKECSLVNEPSTKELREMVQSFPPELREQGPDQVDGTASITMEAWHRIKWWHFSTNASKASWEDFLKCYLFRVLTVSFELKNGVLCSRLLPRLPDLLSAIARTRGAQATVERYYHALVALDAARTKKLRHSQLVETPLLAEAGQNHAYTLASIKGSLLALSPLSVFDLTLSVKEALYFFRPAFDSCAPGWSAATQRSAEPTSPYRSVRGRYSLGGEGNSKISEDEESSGEYTISLEEDLILLLEIEGRTALSLPLLSSSHWGRHVLPRLTVI